MPNEDLTKILETLASGAKDQQEAKEPGPGDVGPTIDTKETAAAGVQNPLVPVPMSEAEQGAWEDRIKGAQARIDQRSETWDVLLNEYLPQVSASGKVEDVKVNAHFRNVHTKIGSLFYKSPDLILGANDPSPAQNVAPPPPPPMPGQPPGPPMMPSTMEEIIIVKQEVLNKVLGRDGIKANRLMDELLFDVLAWAGIGCAKIGYRCTMKVVKQPVMGPDPTFVAPPGSMLGLQPAPTVPQMGPDGQMLTQDVKVPIFEEFYGRRFSPKKFLCNADLRSTRFDEDATWEGMKFFMAPDKAMKAFKLTDDQVSKASEDTAVYQYPEDKSGNETIKLVEGVEIYCKSAYFTDEVHPEAFHQLIFIKGIAAPVVWRPSPDQEFEGPFLKDPNTGQPTQQPNPKVGQLTDDSLKIFPYRILTIRDLADSCFPPSDSAFTNSQVKQLNTHRRQSVQLRDSATAKYLLDGQYLEDEDEDKIKNGTVGEFIILKDGSLQGGADKIVVPIVQAHASPDDYRLASTLKSDMDETLGISAVQSGQVNQSVHSATEVRDVSNAIQARNEKERSRAVDFYLDLARGIDTLLMRYADQDLYAQITGNDGATKMMKWNHQKFVGKYLYDISPDSQMAPDNARDYTLLLNYYNQAAKDPLFNRAYVHRKLSRMMGLDPNKVVLPPAPPPPPKPEPLKISLSLVPTDLRDPVVLNFIKMYQGLVDASVKEHPAGQPEHGGANTPGETVSQHAASNSGGAENVPGSVNHRATQVK